MAIPVAVLVNISAVWLALAAMVVLGVGYRLSLIAGRTLLQGSTPDDVLTRIFGVLEGLNMLSIALGAFLVLLLDPVLGLATTLVATGLIYPIAVAVTAPRLAAIDATRPQLDPELVALLRTVPIFAPLSAYQIEQLALTAEHSTLDDGDVVITEGEPGSTAYVIAHGRVSITRGGEPVARVGRGEYFGEIALLRDTPRTATVEAVGPVELFGFRRDEFLAALTGCRRAHVLAHRTADERGTPER